MKSTHFGKTSKDLLKIPNQNMKRKSKKHWQNTLTESPEESLKIKTKLPQSGVGIATVNPTTIKYKEVPTNAQANSRICGQT